MIDAVYGLWFMDAASGFFPAKLLTLLLTLSPLGFILRCHNLGNI